MLVFLLPLFGIRGRLCSNFLASTVSQGSTAETMFERSLDQGRSFCPLVWAPSRNPYKPMLAPIQTTLKTGARSSDPFKEGKTACYGPQEKSST